MQSKIFKKAIRLVIEQSSAQYRVPHEVTGYYETYLLPPPSTIIGMIHACCGFQEYVPMDISIAGSFKEKGEDLSTIYDFGNFQNDGRGYMTINGALKDKSIGYGTVYKGVRVQQELRGINLIVYIIPENDDMLSILLNGMNNPKLFPSLGRNHDKCNIKEVSEVALYEYETEDEIATKEGLEDNHQLMLVPSKYIVSQNIMPSTVDDSIDSFGVRMRLNKDYVKVENNKKEIRVFNKVDVTMVSDIISDCGYIDKENNTRVFPV